MADPNSHGNTPSPSLSNQSLAALTLGFIVCAVGIAAYGFIAAPGAHAMGWPSMTVALVASVFGLSGLCAFLLFRIRDLATSQVEQRRSSQIESKAPRGEDSPAGDPFADPNSDPNFRSLIENTQNGLALWLRQEDGTYALKAVNSGYCKLFGYESGTDVSVLTEIHRSGVIGAQWPWQAALNALARDGIVRNATPSGRHKNGTVIPLRATYWVVKDSDGEISGVWAFLRDRREELTVDLDRDLKNRAFEQSRVGIAIIATEGGMPSSIYYANRAHVDMNGQEAGDPFAVDVFLADRKAVVDPREADAFLADITNLRRTQIRIRRENPDGGFLVQSISFSPILDDQGEATHWISFSADISEAASYAEENRTLRLAIDQIPVSISIFGPDAHSRPMFYNPKFEDLAGLTTDEIETIGNMNFADLGFIDQETLDQLNRKKASKRPSETTFAYNHPKYGDRIYRQQLAPVRNETGTIRNWISVVEDITEKTHIEQQREVLLQAIAQSPTSIVISELDNTGEPIIQYVNPAFETLTGFSADEVIGESSRMLRSSKPEDIQSNRDIVAKFRSGQQSSFVRHSVRKDGSEYTREVRVAPVMNAAGQVTHLLTLSNDITDRIRDDLHLKKLQHAIEHTDSAITIVDIDPSSGEPIISYANPAYARALGYTQGELIGQPTSLTKSRNHRGNNAGKEIVRALEEDCSVSITFESQRKDGHWIIREADFTPVFDDTGKAAGWIVVSRDITQRKLNEAKLQRTATILENLSESVFFVDTEFVIRDCNARAVDLLGVAREQLIGSHCAEFHSVQHKDNPDDFSRFADEPKEGRGQFQKASGEIITVDWSTAPLREEDGTNLGWICVARDVTEKIVMEEQIQHARKMEAVGQLTGGIAHDFNNLLGVISGSLQLIQEEESDWAFVRDMASRADRATLRGRDLVSRLLAFSRRQTLNAVETDIGDVIEGLAILMTRSIGEAVTLSSTISRDLRACKVDQTLLETALVNLVLNARDAMPDSGSLTINAENVDINASLASNELSEGSYVRIDVADTGTGMSPEIMDKVFEPFFTTKEVGQGTGLGLSMVYGFVKQSDGHITVTSTPGKGTQFSIYLPALQASLCRASHPADHPDKASQPPSRLILVIEDNDDMREICAATLKRIGYQVLSASGPEEALTCIEEKPDIDAAFIDLMLSEGQLGTDLAAEIKRRKPDIRILFTSGFSDQGILSKAKALADVVPKPFKLEDVRARLLELLD